jgi:probable F420-dependent oxidoreductase
MKIGVFPPAINPIANGDYIAATAKAAEERGFDCYWAPEHVVLFNNYQSKYPYTQDGRLAMRAGSGVLDPFLVLTHVAAHTSRIRLGTGICLVPQRNPVYTAKQVATLDFLSGGRVDFGIGIGWLKEEFAAVDAPWPNRGDRTDAYIRLMRELWTQPEATWSDEFYSLAPTLCDPKPVQDPLPVLVGGDSDAALRRAARIGNGWFGFDHDPSSVKERVGKLREYLEAEGRTLEGFRVIISPYTRRTDAALVEQYAEAGADELVLIGGARDAEGMVRVLDELAESAVEPALRV